MFIGLAEYHSQKSLLLAEMVAMACLDTRLFQKALESIESRKGHEWRNIVEQDISEARCAILRRRS